MVVRRQQETFEPVTMGHIRSHGCRDLLVYCISERCHHSATINGDWLQGDARAAGRCIELRFGVLILSYLEPFAPALLIPRREKSNRRCFVLFCRLRSSL